MSAPGESSQFQFEKRRAAAILTLSTGVSLQGDFFIAGGITSHEGPERVGEMLNSEPGFFPFEIPNGPASRTVLVNRAHVVTVVLADDEATGVPGYSVAKRVDVQMLLSTGERIVGAVRIYRPAGRDRLSDWTRQPEAFLYLETGGRTLIVNSAHIIEASEAPTA
jgi:hypothetical protein